MVFIDESGFLLIPNVRRTWAPKGQTPIVHHQIRNGKLSAVSALAISPKHRRIALYLQFRRGSLKAKAIKRFLGDLLKQVGGPVMVLWDRNPIHKDRAVQAFIQQHSRLECRYFPGYAPELNPAEYVWAQADAALANSSPEDLCELKTLLRNVRRRICQSNQLLWSCLYAADLPWTR